MDAEPVTYTDAISVLEAVPHFIENARTKRELGVRSGSPVLCASVNFGNGEYGPYGRTSQVTAGLEQIPGGQVMWARVVNYDINRFGGTYEQIHEEREAESRIRNFNNTQEVFCLAVVGEELLTARKDVLSVDKHVKETLVDVAEDNPFDDAAVDVGSVVSRTRMEFDMTREDCDMLLGLFAKAPRWIRYRAATVDALKETPFEFPKG